MNVNFIKYDSVTYKILAWFEKQFSKINWCSIRALWNKGIYWTLTEADHDYLRGALKKDYFIICAARSCHLTTSLIRMISKLNGQSDAYYTHVLMNTEDGEAAENDDFRLFEATGPGVHYSTFMEVFDVDSVALLKPKNMTLDDWTAAIDAARVYNGTPYDDIFNLLDNTHLSCVELMVDALRKVPNYAEKFPNLEAMIAKEGNLTPQMFYDCADFEVHWEVRRS